jgi:hypothetical protein
LRFLTIEIRLPVRRKGNEAHAAFCGQRRAVRWLRCNTVAIEEKLLYSRPKSAPHQWIDLWQTIPLQYRHLAGPFARAVAEDATGDLSLVRIERWIWRSMHCRDRCRAPSDN